MTSTLSSKTIRTERKAEDYETMSHVEHILRVPDTYIGSAEPVQMDKIIYAEGKIVRKQILFCEGIERLFIEILSNAVDNIINSRFMEKSIYKKKLYGKDIPPPIKISITPTTVTILNGGEPIPIVPHTASCDGGDKLVLIPDVIFGQLLSSSNYNTNIARVSAGRNGYGGKLVNIYSKEFNVRIGDPIRGVEYSGQWRNNMSEGPNSTTTPKYVFDKKKQEWKIESGVKKYDGESYVMISYDIDFSRFKPLIEYFDDIIGVFFRIAMDYSFTAKIPIEINGIVYDFRNPRDFASFYFPHPSSDVVCAKDECAKDEEEEDDIKEEEEEIQQRKMVLWYGWNTDEQTAQAEKIKGKDGISNAIITGRLPFFPAVELIVIDTPDCPNVIGFVNGIIVPYGVHINEAITKTVAAMIAASPISATTAKAGVTTVNAADVKNHISIIVNCNVIDPKFTSQTKQVLASPCPKMQIKPDIFKQAMASSNDDIRWEVARRIAEAVELKMRRAVAKTDGKKSKRVMNISGASDANYAGTGQSARCTLWLTEGDSAAAYTAKRIAMLEGRKDFHGIYGLRGKFINVTAASISLLCKNKEYAEFKTMMGLAESLDYTHTECFKTLRYGKICIATDADDDGASIRALLINCIAAKWRSLIRLGCIAYLATPAIRVTNPKTGEIVERFYSDTAFYEWAKDNEAKLKGMRVRHIKGLASSGDKDIKDDLDTAPTIHIVFDDHAKENLDLAFSSKRADDRKRWIENWRQNGHVAQNEDIILEPLSRAAVAARKPTTKGGKQQQAQISCPPPSIERSVSNIINKDLAEYSFASLFRAIASSSDGLKRSQRQALWHCLNYWNFGHTQKDSLKVSRLAAAVAEATSYAHGEASMQGTLVTMAQDFTGSNNLPVLFPDGQFGTREGGPTSNGAPRYIYTKTNWMVPYLFDKEAMNLVARRSVEGELAETEWIPCDICLVACNGARGIATGWSSFIPCHNPSDIVNWTINRIKFSPEKLKSALPPIVPWYKDFAGTMELSKRGGEADDSSSSDDDSELSASGADDKSVTTTATKRKTGGLRDGNFVISCGKCSVLREPTRQEPTYDVEITELPIGGLWIGGYVKFLESLIQAGRLSGFKDLSTTERPHFILTKLSTVPIPKQKKKKQTNAGKKSSSIEKKMAQEENNSLSFPPPPLTPQFLKLIKSQSLNNMVLIDDDGVPTRYSTIEDVLEVHFKKMEAHYVKIKQARIKWLENELKELNDRHGLLSAIVSGKLVVFKRKEADILADIKTMKLSEKMYEVLKMRDATAEKIKEIEDKIASTEITLKETRAKPSSKIWLDRLMEFRNVLQKISSK